MTTRYDVAKQRRTPEEMAAYFEACLDEADGDAAFNAKALEVVGIDSRAPRNLQGEARTRQLSVSIGRSASPPAGAAGKDKNALWRGRCSTRAGSD